MEGITGLLYKEEQNLPAWVYFLFLIWFPILLILPVFKPEIFERWEFLLAILAILFVDLLILGITGKLVVIVRWNEMIIQTGFLKLTRTRIKKAEIKNVKIIEGDLWKKYGGWGIRTNSSLGTVAYVYSGKGGVEIEVERSYKFLTLEIKLEKIVVSSRNPARLMDAIMSMT